MVLQGVDAFVQRAYPYSWGMEAMTDMVAGILNRGLEGQWLVQSNV
jgi:hypothetical protein